MLVKRATGDHAKTACGSLQLCAGLDAGIEGATHAVAQMRPERTAMESGGGVDEGSEGSEDESVAEKLRQRGKGRQRESEG